MLDISSCWQQVCNCRHFTESEKLLAEDRMFGFQCLTGRHFLFNVTCIPALESTRQWVWGTVPGVKWPTVMTDTVTNSAFGTVSYETIVS